MNSAHCGLCNTFHKTRPFANSDVYSGHDSNYHIAIGWRWSAWFYCQRHLLTIPTHCCISQVINSDIGKTFTCADEEEGDATILKPCPVSHWQHGLTHLSAFLQTILWRATIRTEPASTWRLYKTAAQKDGIAPENQKDRTKNDILVEKPPSLKKYIFILPLTQCRLRKYENMKSIFVINIWWVLSSVVSFSWGLNPSKGFNWIIR